MRKLISITKLALAQSLRNKVFMFMSLIMLALVGVLPFAVTSDGTLKGKIVVLIEYSLLFGSFFLFLGSIWLSICSVREEYIKKTFYTLFTKPVTKRTILLGKFLGVYVHTALLFVLCAGILLGNIFLLTKDATDEEMNVIKSEVLSGRSVLAVNQDNIEIKPQQKKHFKFDISELYIDGSDVFIRFRFYLSDVEHIRKMYPYVSGVWTLVGSDYEVKRKFHNKNFNEIVIPAKYIENGKFELKYENISSNAIVFFSENIEIMAQTDSFYRSFGKIFSLKLLILALFTAFGIFVSSYMTFVPAVFVGVSFYFVSNAVSFLKSILAKAVILGPAVCDHCHETHGHAGDAPVEPGLFDNILRIIIKGIVYIFPDIDNLDKVDFLAAAKAVSNADVITSVKTIAIYTGFFLILAFIILSFAGDYSEKE